jgi:hypothetical protein
MKRAIAVILLLFAVSLILLQTGCEKEKIVESTEYVRDVEYVEVPPDTIYQVDTITNHDSTTVTLSDTVTITDTIVQVDYVYDTVRVYDTVETVVNHYDTTVVVDTVETVRCNPNEYLAIAALQYYVDPLVLEFINSEFGYSDGWIFYLSSFQLELTRQSSTTYDIYGYIDYWTPDWSGYYPLEYYWRLTFTGGDPADPQDWQLSDPPTGSPSLTPGIKLIPDATQRSIR